MESLTIIRQRTFTRRIVMVLLGLASMLVQPQARAEVFIHFGVPHVVIPYPGYFGHRGHFDHRYRRPVHPGYYYGERFDHRGGHHHRDRHWRGHKRRHYQHSNRHHHGRHADRHRQRAGNGHHRRGGRH